MGFRSIDSNLKQLLLVWMGMQGSERTSHLLRNSEPIPHPHPWSSLFHPGCWNKLVTRQSHWRIHQTGFIHCSVTFIRFYAWIYVSWAVREFDISTGVGAPYLQIQSFHWVNFIYLWQIFFLKYWWMLPVLLKSTGTAMARSSLRFESFIVPREIVFFRFACLSERGVEAQLKGRSSLTAHFLSMWLMWHLLHSLFPAFRELFHQLSHLLAWPAAMCL